MSEAHSLANSSDDLSLPFYSTTTLDDFLFDFALAGRNDVIHIRRQHRYEPVNRPIWRAGWNRANVNCRDDKKCDSASACAQVENIVMEMPAGKRLRITASDLHAYHQCPHRVWRDANDDPDLMDPVNEFDELLWERGTQYEKKVIHELKKGAELLDLSVVPVGSRLLETQAAIKKLSPLIYHGRLENNDLIGEPDLL